MTKKQRIEELEKQVVDLMMLDVYTNPNIIHNGDGTIKTTFERETPKNGVTIFCDRAGAVYTGYKEGAVVTEYTIPMYTRIVINDRSKNNQL